MGGDNFSVTRGDIAAVGFFMDGDGHPFLSTDFGNTEAKLEIGFQLRNVNQPEFWRFKCSCGVVDSFAMNELPSVTTRQSCGKDGHFSVVFGEIPNAA